MLFLGNIGSLMPLLMAIVTFGSMAFGWYKGKASADESLAKMDAPSKIEMTEPFDAFHEDVDASNNIQLFQMELEVESYLRTAKHFVQVRAQAKFHQPILKTSTPHLCRYQGLSPPFASIA